MNVLHLPKKKIWRDKYIHDSLKARIALAWLRTEHEWNVISKHQHQAYALPINSNRKSRVQFSMSYRWSITHSHHFYFSWFFSLHPFFKNLLWCEVDSLMHFTHSVEVSTSITSSTCTSTPSSLLSLLWSQANRTRKKIVDERRNERICQTAAYVDGTDAGWSSTLLLHSNF